MKGLVLVGLLLICKSFMSVWNIYNSSIWEKGIHQVIPIKKILTALIILLSFKAVAQNDSIDLFGSRLLVNDILAANASEKSNKAYFIKFYPTLTYSIWSLPTNTLVETELSGTRFQNYHTFTYKNSIGYLEHASTLNFKGNSQALASWLFLGAKSLYQFCNSNNELNTFYQIYVYHSLNDLRTNDYDNYLRADKLQINSDGSVDTIFSENKYLYHILWSNSSAIVANSGFVTNSPDGINKFIHLINNHDSTYEIYSFYEGAINKIRSQKNIIFSTSHITDPNTSPNSRIIVFPEELGYDGASQLYIYEDEVGDNPVLLDTFRQYTIDTSGKNLYATQLHYGNAKLSPTGRFLYVTEEEEGIFHYISGPHAGTVRGYNSIVRMLQVDLAPLLSGGSPKVNIVKEWSAPNTGTRIFLHTVAPDGRLYYCLESVAFRDNSEKMSDTTISLWRIDNPELEMNTGSFSKNTTMVIDNLLFPVVYRQSETYNPASWWGYPYHAVVKGACAGDLTGLALQGRVPFDSVVWEVGDGKILHMVWPDTAMNYNFNGKAVQDIKFHVWRKGYEDVIYTTLYSPAGYQRHDELRTLPRLITECNEKPVILQPGKDTLAVKTGWADGYKQKDRVITKSGIYVWQVWYDTTRCPRNDSVTVYISDINKASLSNLTTCDSSNALLHIDDLSKGIITHWNDGDSVPAKKVTSQGMYTVHLTDTLSGCTKDLSAHVTFLKYVKPKWYGLDTSICENESLYLKAPAGSGLLGTSGKLEDSIRLSAAGTYYIAYKPKAEGANCDWKQASVILNILSRDSSQCQPKPECKWYLPNAFSPNADTKNEIWEPVSSCDNTTYELNIFNRWAKEYSVAQIKAGMENLKVQTYLQVSISTTSAPQILTIQKNTEKERLR